MAGSVDVDAWMATYENPQKALVQRVRDFALSADRRIGECIKWQVPTFIYKGNIASFFPKAKAHVSLMFHKSGLIAGDFPHLEGDGSEARTFKIANEADLVDKSDELARIFRAWCDQRDQRG